MGTNGILRFFAFGTEGIRMFCGLTSWTGLNCWIYNTNRAAWYKQAMENKLQNDYSYAIVPVPVRFKHRFKVDSFDCYALDDYIATYGNRNATGYDEFIYRFKDGKPLAGPWETVRLMEQAQRREQNLAGKLSDAVLSVIPASAWGGVINVVSRHFADCCVKRQAWKTGSMQSK